MAAPRRHSVIICKEPNTVPGYPYPQCITGGWPALLSGEERGLVDTRVKTMKAADPMFYAGYTGFDALSPESQASIRSKLAENKLWERRHGPVFFQVSGLIDSTILGNVAQSDWKATFCLLYNRWLTGRRRQVMRMTGNNEYLVRSYIFRT
jgi:hypothetical protein